MFASDLHSIPGFTDPVSSLSHLGGAVVFAVLGVALVRRARRTPRRDIGDRAAISLAARLVSLAVFSASAVLLLATSGVFHMLGHAGPARGVLQRLDHAAIFVLIAGTYTPIHAILFRGVWRWGMLAFIWTFAALGVTLKSIFFASTPATLGIALYVGMGWIGLLSMIALARRFGAPMIWSLLAGGVAYTLGAVVEWAEPRPLIAAVVRAHEVFHVAVLVGLGLHWWFIWTISDTTLHLPLRLVRESRDLASGRHAA